MLGAKGSVNVHMRAGAPGVLAEEKVSPRRPGNRVTRRGKMTKEGWLVTAG